MKHNVKKLRSKINSEIVLALQIQLYKELAHVSVILYSNFYKDNNSIRLIARVINDAQNAR